MTRLIVQWSSIQWVIRRVTPKVEYFMVRVLSIPVLLLSLSCTGQSPADSGSLIPNDEGNPEGIVVFDYTVWNCMTGDIITELK